jgi:DNA uptake protein ComE-like DNA-binding protein
MKYIFGAIFWIIIGLFVGGWWGFFLIVFAIIGSFSAAAEENKTSSASASETLPSPKPSLDKTSTTNASGSQPLPGIQVEELFVDIDTASGLHKAFGSNGQAQARPVDINTALGLPNDFGSDGQAQERPVDINTADREALLALPGIGVAEAGLIVKRTQSGQGFGTLEELADYLSLKPHKTSRLRGKVRFSSRPRGEIGLDDKAKAHLKAATFGRVID